MKKAILMSLVFGAILGANETQMLLKPKSAIRGSEAIFSGEVKITELFGATSFQNFGGGLVEFSANARSAWHTHPAGQTLLVVSGAIISGSESGEISLAQKGEVIICPPNIRHWHGATNSQSGAHIAITSYKDGKNVIWLEKVSDKEYKDALKKAGL